MIVEYRHQRSNGYWALAAALRRGVDEGFAPWDAAALANLTENDVRHLLRPHRPGAPEIPLLPERLANLRELGRGLLAAYPGGAPVTDLIADANGSAVRLVELTVRLFPSFNDVATLDGREVRFYKRAQILAADLHGAFAGNGLGRFDDLDALTAFADYKVPQVLRALGALRYTDELPETIAARRPIPAGSREEIEIRAATVWACELIRRSLAALGRPLRAFEIDWALWQAGQSLTAETAPYHRTATIFY